MPGFHEIFVRKDCSISQFTIEFVTNGKTSMFLFFYEILSGLLSASKMTKVDTDTWQIGFIGLTLFTMVIINVMVAIFLTFPT